jgi:hypothetical protein
MANAPSRNSASCSSPRKDDHVRDHQQRAGDIDAHVAKLQWLGVDTSERSSGPRVDQ